MGGKFLETFLAFVSGALVALMGSWIQEEYRQSAEAETWFQTQYILEGIDPVQNYTSMLEILIKEHNFPLDLTEEFPKLGLVNMHSMIETTIVTEYLVYILNQIQLPPPKRDNRVSDEQLQQAAEKLTTMLRNFRKQLLLIDIDRKSDVVAISDKPFVEAFRRNATAQLKALRGG